MQGFSCLGLADFGLFALERALVPFCAARCLQSFVISCFMLEKVKQIEDCSVEESKLLKIYSLSERTCVQVGTSHTISGHF